MALVVLSDEEVIVAWGRDIVIPRRLRWCRWGSTEKGFYQDVKQCRSRILCWSCHGDLTAIGHLCRVPGNTLAFPLTTCPGVQLTSCPGLLH